MYISEATCGTVYFTKGESNAYKIIVFLHVISVLGFLLALA
jgi:hypothetical protein